MTVSDCISVTARAVVLDCWHPTFTCSSGKTWMELKWPAWPAWPAHLRNSYFSAIWVGCWVSSDQEAPWDWKTAMLPCFWLNFVCSRTASCSLKAYAFSCVVLCKWNCGAERHGSQSSLQRPSTGRLTQTCAKMKKCKDARPHCFWLLVCSFSSSRFKSLTNTNYNKCI